MALAVETKALTRVFKPRRKVLKRRKSENGGAEGPVTALEGVDLEIPDGELFGLLGPNGAGKTTLIKILCTLLLPTSGQALVAGHDVAKDAFPIRTKINMVSGGETSGYGLLTTRENIWMFSQFYGVPSKGLDVNASRVIREYVMNWVRQNRVKTVLLTTHYMMEADEMCDRLAIIDHGQILAVDTPERLKRRLKRDTTFRLEVDPLRDTARFKAIPGVKNFSQTSDGGASLEKLTFILEDESAVSDIMSEVVRQGSKIHYLHKSEPTLEDVFVSIVGRALE